MMPNFTFTNATATIGTTEYSLAKNASYSAGSPMTTIGYVQAVIDVVANMAAGDEYEIRVYEKANAGTQRPIFVSRVGGAQFESYVTPLMLLGEGWDITMKKTAGIDRSILFSVRQDTNDVNAASISNGAITSSVIASSAIGSSQIAAAAITAGKFATDAIDANALAASAVTEIQTGLPSGTDYTTARAAKLDNLDAAISTRASATTVATAMAAIQAGTDDIQARLPSALVGGKMSSDVGSWLGTTPVTPTVAGVPKVEVSTIVANAIGSSQIAANAITANKFAADAIDSNALASNAVTEIQSGLATSSALTTAQTDLTTLTGRLTPTRAASLDNLDAAVTTRAAAATAVSNADYTSARAARLDNVDAAVSTRAPASTALSTAQWTNARATSIDHLDADISTRAAAATAISNTDYTSARAAKIDNLDATIGSRAPSSTALSTTQWTNSRAAALDNLDTPVSDIGTSLSEVATAVDSVQADTTNLRSRVPAVLDTDGNMKAGIQSLTSGSLSAIANSIFSFIIEAAPTGATTFLEKVRHIWSILAGPAEGLTIPVASTAHFKSGDGTKVRSTHQLNTDGTRTPGTFDGT